MGASVCAHFGDICPHNSGIYVLVPAVRRWRSRFQMLRLTESEVSHLYTIYKCTDLSQKNSVKTAHLMSYLKIENAPFARRMLHAFNAGVKFEAFVFEIWDICTIDEDCLGKTRCLTSSDQSEIRFSDNLMYLSFSADFVFDMYDENDSGDITALESHVMLKELYGDTFFDPSSKKRYLCKLFLTAAYLTPNSSPLFLARIT